MPSQPRIHLPSLFQLIASGLAVIVGLSTALVLYLAGLGNVVINPNSPDSLLLFSLAWTSVMVSSLLVPPGTLALLRLMKRRPTIPWLRAGMRLSALLLLLVPLLLLGGGWAARYPLVDWLILPPIHILVISIPLWWVVEFGRRGLSAGSEQRGWGLFSLGLLAVPVLALLLETMALMALLIIGSVWLAATPDMSEAITIAAQQMVDSEMDPAVIEQILLPFIKQPFVIAILLGLVAGVVPVLEELVKPLGVWFLALRRPTPSEGFVGGLLSGSAFALIESLSLMSAPVGEGWPLLVVGRIGTGILHTTTCGMVGWGLASVWRDRRYGRLALGFGGAVFFHGLWNLLSIVIGLDALLEFDGLLSNVVAAAPVLLVTLAALMLAVLVVANYRLRQGQSSHNLVEAPLPDNAL